MKNLNISAKEWIRMRSSEDLEEQKLSASIDLPSSVWFEIIERYPDYSEWVAHNKKIPMDVLKFLAEQSDEKTRFTVSTKNKANLDILEILSENNPSDSIRRNLVNHRNSSKELVAKFINDSWDVVAEEARERLANWKD